MVDFRRPGHICILQVRNLPSRKVDLTINSCFVCVKRKVISVAVLSINRIDKCHVPAIKISPLFAHDHWYPGINQNTQGSKLTGNEPKYHERKKERFMWPNISFDLGS